MVYLNVFFQLQESCPSHSQNLFTKAENTSILFLDLSLLRQENKVNKSKIVVLRNAIGKYLMLF